MLKQWCIRVSTLLAAGCLFVQAPALRAANPAPAGTSPKDADALAAAIDAHVSARWAAEGVKPAEPADDAAFLRRAYLDLAGKIPPVSEVRAFLDDPASDKRQRLVERLLDSPGYVNHFTNVWRSQMLPDGAALAGARPEFDAWLRRQLEENTGYDQVARGVLTAGAVPGLQSSPGGAGEPTPIAFYQTGETTPEALASRTSRLFLGVRLDCAQCHDHKFTDLSRDQFWQLAAFFGPNAASASGAAPQIPITGTSNTGASKTVRARFLDGSEPRFEQGVHPRLTLADWVATAENPYFAKAVVNRYWAHFFGVGLVDPVDDLIPENKPSHPELLDELARQFALNNFDVKYLIRAITASRTYQLSSVAPKGAELVEARLFSRMPVRGLSPDQLLASLAQATGHRDSLQQGQLASFGVNSRAEFLAKFANPSENATEVQTSLLQALAIMNGRFMDDVTSLERSETLVAIVDGPFRGPERQVEALYLAALSRRPRPEETERLVKYVTEGGATGDSRKALGDVFWALLNSGEFVSNH